MRFWRFRSLREQSNQPAGDGRDRQRTIASYAVAASLVAPALWCELVAGPEFQFLAFSLAVAVSAWQGGLGPAILTIVLESLASDYFLLSSSVFLRVDAPYRAYALAGIAVGWFGVCLGLHLMYRGTRRERDLRANAEHAAAHADRLAQVAGALGRARTSVAVIEACVQESLHAMRADACMLLIIRDDGKTAVIARAVAYSSSAVALQREVSLEARSPLGDAAERGATVAVESAEAWLAEYPEAPDSLRLADFQAAIAVPLLVGSRVAAIVRLDFRGRRTLSAQDSEFLSVLGPSAGQALDRARQFEAAQRARAEAEAQRARADQELVERQKTEQALRASETRHRSLAHRTARMHELTAALSEAVTVNAVARAVVQHGTSLVGATTAAVSLLRENGTRLETLDAEAEGQPLKEAHSSNLEVGLCATEAIRTRSPILVPSWVEGQEQFWRSASRAADAACLSSAVLPLLVDTEPIGVLEFHFSVPVNFDAEYQALLVSVAQHCTQAFDRAKLYESAQSARRDAETANRLKDDFLSIVSHELRTPLNVVVGWSALLRDRALSPDITERAVGSIYDNAMRQAQLIDDLLDVSKLTTGEPAVELQDVNLAGLLAGVAESAIPAAAASNITVTVRPVPEVVIPGDWRRLEQVFFNLLSNALKFTPPGGRITIDASCAENTVEVRVSDSGVGIEPDFLPHVFDRFWQADSTRVRSHGGLGLGLTIVKQIVEAHGGTIAVESAGRNLGTTFTVRLPAAARQGERPAPRRHTGGNGSHANGSHVNGAPHLEGIHVLVVDDEPDAREFVAHALQIHGARVTGAMSAAEAFEVLDHSDIDVLLVDIAMPDEDGYSFLRRVRASADGRIAAIPAAAVTAHARFPEREEAFAAGFQRHLAKPVDPSLLASTVDQLAHPESAEP
jgi:signal transduction histidine kinase/ActR/RegA family two-component response regulator